MKGYLLEFTGIGLELWMSHHESTNRKRVTAGGKNETRFQAQVSDPSSYSCIEI